MVLDLFRRFLDSSRPRHLAVGQNHKKARRAFSDRIEWLERRTVLTAGPLDTTFGSDGLASTDFTDLFGYVTGKVSLAAMRASLAVASTADTAKISAVENVVAVTAETGHVLEVDGNGGAPQGLTDGALLFGYLAGLTNSQLARFVAPNATRTVPQIRTYLDQLKIGSTLDADGSGGTPDGFTDGALFYGRLAGVSNSGLQQYVSTSATRNVTQIRNYIDNLDVTLNTGPSITVPAPQTVAMSASLTLTSGLAVTDSAAGSNPLEVTLSAIGEGLVTLSGVSGLSFSQGTGTGEDFMIFRGTVQQINSALAGLVFAPTLFAGTARLRILVSDLGNGGSSTPRTASAEFRAQLDTTQGTGPEIQVLLESNDGRIMQAMRPDGTIIDYYGTRNSEGLVTGLQSAIVHHPDGFTQTIQYDSQGRMISVLKSNGDSFTTTWNTATNITVRVQVHGSAPVTVTYDLPSVAPALLRSMAPSLSVNDSGPIMSQLGSNVTFDDYCQSVANGIDMVCNANEMIGGNKYGLCLALAAESGPAAPEVLAVCESVFVATDLTCSTVGASPAPGAPNVATNICQFIKEQEAKPKLEVGPTNLELTPSVNDGESVERQFTIRNLGSLETDYSITASLSQIHLSSSSGHLDKNGEVTIHVTAVADGLQPGSHPATITITAGQQTLTIAVTVKVVVGHVSATPIEMHFTAKRFQASPPAQSFTVTNDGPTFSKLHYSVTPNTNRPTITQTDGNPTSLAPGSSNTYSITINTSNLDTGEWRDFIDIVNTDDPQQKVTISIITIVEEAYDFRGTYSGTFSGTGFIFENTANGPVSGSVSIRVDSQELSQGGVYSLHGTIEISTDHGSLNGALTGGLNPDLQTGALGNVVDQSTPASRLTVIAITFDSIAEDLLSGKMNLQIINFIEDNTFNGFSLTNVPIVLRP